MKTSTKQTIEQIREKRRLYGIQSRKKLREHERESLAFIYADIDRVYNERKLNGTLLCCG
jgi:hypothetical protein